MTERNMKLALEEAKKVVGMIEADALTDAQKEDIIKESQNGKMKAKYSKTYTELNLSTAQADSVSTLADTATLKSKRQ